MVGTGPIQNFRNWWKRQRTLVKWGGVVVLVIAGGVILGGGNNGEIVIETVKRQDLVRTVSATGTTVSTTDLSLSFQQSNIIKSINISVGDEVRKGQILAALSNASESASVQSARGTLLLAKAKYNKALEGERDEAIQSAEITVENARRKLYSDDLVAKPESTKQTSTPPVISGGYSNTETGEYRIEFKDFNKNDFRYFGLERGEGEVETSPEPLGTRGLKIQFDDKDEYAANDVWVVKIPNTSGLNYVVNLNALRSAEAELVIKKAQTRSTDIEAALAEVISAEGAVASAQATLDKTIIRAPADGTVTKVYLKPGELAETFEPVITLQDVGNLYIEANVNESSISNISLGQLVNITYDAFGKGEISSSTVSSIDLGATVVDGIVNYKIKAVVVDPINIRSGMTANMVIQTAFMPSVLVVPDRVIKEEGGKKVVEVLVDERRHLTEAREITTGLRGDGGLVEITSGLYEGERVIFSSK